MTFPLIEPFDTGMLPVGDGNTIYWEASGNPSGKPAVFLHGGPGAGLGAGGYRRTFDPDRYLVVGLDQRGCGRSLPLVTDRLEALQQNTTQALIADIEMLRRHLGFESWTVTGVSWGTTLALAYAQTRPDRVTELALLAVTTTSSSEVEWISETVGRLFPREWDAFERASRREPGERLVDAYHRLLTDGDPAVRTQAAIDWDAWENVHVSLDPRWAPVPGRGEDPVWRATFATLVTHYWKHAAFLPGDTPLLDGMARIGHIPGILIHGRYDVSCAAVTAVRLHERWPASRLVIVDDEGHGGPRMSTVMREALADFAAVPS